MASNPALAGAVAELAVRLQNGVFLYEGGSQYYVVFPGESVKLGAELVNFSATARPAATVRLTVTPEGAPDAVYTKEFVVELPAGKSRAVLDAWTPDAARAKAYSVRAELLQDGRVIDVQGWLELFYEPGKHLVLCGMNEGMVPARNAGDPWLGEAAGKQLGLIVNAGHGLKYHNTKAVAAIKGIEELNIGHSIISQAVFVGLEKAVTQMCHLCR